VTKFKATNAEWFQVSPILDPKNGTLHSKPLRQLTVIAPTRVSSFDFHSRSTETHEDLDSERKLIFFGTN
jgi:hypothetical protein